MNVHISLDNITTNDYTKKYGKQSAADQHPAHLNIRSGRSRMGSRKGRQFIGYDRNACEGREETQESAEEITPFTRAGRVVRTLDQP